MTEYQKIGNTGESIAAEYLINKGYKILHRNWQFLHREIDIVALHGNEIVFVEVKTRKINSLISPLEAVNIKKQRFIIDGANLYLQQQKIDKEVRFDIVSVIWHNSTFEVEHIEHAFYPRMRV